MMFAGAKVNFAKARFRSPPVWSAQRRPAPPERLSRILQSKGFMGGVPLNTETAAVKPRVGIAR